IDRAAVPPGAPATMLLSACATDGTYLYVAEHDLVGHRSQFEVLDRKLARVMLPIALPDALYSDGYDRCLDFAHTSRGWYGLFARSGGELNDASLQADRL